MIHGRMLVVMVWLLLLASVGTGFATGVDADTASGAEIEFNGTHLQVGDETTNVVETNQTAHRQAQPEPVRKLEARLNETTAPAERHLPQLMTEREAERFTERMLVVAFGVTAPLMDASASLGYRYGSPAAAEVVHMLVIVAMVLPLGWIVWPLVREVTGP